MTAMLSDLLNEIDYDIWKNYFVYCDGLEEDEYDEEGNGTASLEPLIKIVQEHLGKTHRKQK